MSCQNYYTIYMSSVNLMGYLDKFLQTILLLSAKTFLFDSSDLVTSSSSSFEMKYKVTSWHMTLRDELWQSTAELQYMIILHQ